MEDKDLKVHLPVKLEGGDLYRRIQDGLIIWLNLINFFLHLFRVVLLANLST